MKLTKFNTELFPLLSVGMYDSVFSKSEMAESFYGLSMTDDVPYSEKDEIDYDIDRHKNAIASLATLIINANLSSYKYFKECGILSIECAHIWSPRFYNFDTDRLEFDLNVCDDFYEIARNKVIEWLKDEKKKQIIDDVFYSWKSRDGFITYMPTSVDEMLLFSTYQATAAYLHLVLAINEYEFDDEQAYFEEQWHVNYSYEDFATFRTYSIDDAKELIETKAKDKNASVFWLLLDEKIKQEPDFFTSFCETHFIGEVVYGDKVRSKDELFFSYYDMLDSISNVQIG